MGFFAWVRRSRSATGRGTGRPTTPVGPVGAADGGSTGRRSDRASGGSADLAIEPASGRSDAPGRATPEPSGPASGRAADGAPGREARTADGTARDRAPDSAPGRAPARATSPRPLPRPAGDDARTTPTGRVAKVPADVPTPLTRRRLTDWFAAQGYSWFVDGDGDVGSLWRGRPFWFLCLGQRSEILQVRGQWHRDVAIERLTEVLEVCNEWNADRLWPKAYVRVRDDGTVHVTSEVATDLEAGVTDDQLSDLLHGGISSALALFDELDTRYPDPVSRAP